MMDNDFIKTCIRCARRVDTFREDYQFGLCEPCFKLRAPSIPPFADHLMRDIEPYILWRINQAIAEYALQTMPENAV